MDCIAQRIPYRLTDSFSRIATDYIDQLESLKTFYKYTPKMNGIKEAIEDRKNSSVNRLLLVNELKKQYLGYESAEVNANIELLLSPNTFTITTAHQPNILTGPLYFIYKIAHTISLARDLKNSIPGNDFVPVYYMGSEDADLDELGHIYLDGKKFEWNTKQKGAVGRMKVDKEFLQLIEAVDGRLSVLPNGKEVMDLVRNCYSPGVLIQDATFKFVNELFGREGLLVLIPDNANLKAVTKEIFRDDLLNELPSSIVGQTISKIDAAGYKVQANPREINLFYLKDDMRERIVRKNGSFTVMNSQLSFSEEEIQKELNDHPERFSPNVILRGIFQESILPNVAFIGGGGELAYWLQYKELFEKYNVALPVLVLRNSFLIVEHAIHQKISRLGLEVTDFFMDKDKLLNKLVARDSVNQVKLNGSLANAEEFYDSLKIQAAAIDQTLTKHVDALKSKAVQRLIELEKKMLRAEKRKYSDQQRQIESVREKLFPNDGLQERYDNVLFFLATYGNDIMKKIMENSLSLEQEFVILHLKK